MQNVNYDNTDELEYDDYNIEKQSKVVVVDLKRFLHIFEGQTVRNGQSAYLNYPLK